MKVVFIVVNFNGELFMTNCLSSIYAQSFPDFEVIMVDNGSSDGSVVLVTKNFPQAILIKNYENLGFASANNQAIHLALSDLEVEYVALVNTDAVLDSNWLSILNREIEGLGPKAGGVVGKIKSLKDPSLLDSAGDAVDKATFSFVNRGMGLQDSGQLDVKEEVFSVTAAACLYRRAMLEDIEIAGEFMDEDFFAYFEDVDLCVRARLQGWKFYYVPEALAYHYGSGTSETMTGRKVFLCRRNRVWLAIKSLPLKDLIWVLPKYVLPTWGKSRYRKKRKFLQELPLYLSSLKSAVVKMPQIIRKRRQIQNKKRINREELMKWFKSQSSS